MKKERQFKQTEIGIIPEDWEIITLKEACIKIGSGITPRGAEKVYKKDGCALIRSQNVCNNEFKTEGLVFIDKNMAEEMKNVEVKEADILLNITGDSVARCCMVNKNVLPARVNQHVSIVRATSQKLDPKFLQSYLTTKKMQDFMLSLAQTGGTRNALTKAMIESFIIPKPDLSEQEQISKIIQDLDSKIELNQQMNNTLEAIGQVIFKRWFVDFEFPNEKGKPYKSSGGEMVDSELGDIPEEWKIYKTIEIVKQLKPGTNYQPKRVESGIPFINVKNIQKGFLNLNDVKYITKGEFERVHKYWIPEEHDVLITRIGTLGNVAVIRKCDLPVAVHYNSIDIKAKLTSFQFLYFLFNTDDFQRKYHVNKKQSVQEYVTIDEVEKIKLALPVDINTLKKYESIFIDLFNKIELNASNIENLSKIRDSLLPKLMSGKIRVPVEVRK